jgi:hypothetical protein
MTHDCCDIVTYDLRAKPPSNDPSGGKALPAAQGTIFSVVSCVSNVKRDLQQSMVEIKQLIEENKKHEQTRKLRRVLWALSGHIVKCKKFKRPLAVGESRKGVPTKIIQGTLAVTFTIYSSVD